MAPQALEFKISTFGLRSSELTNRGKFGQCQVKVQSCTNPVLRKTRKLTSAPIVQFLQNIFHCKLQNPWSLPSTPAKIPACPTMQHIALCLEKWKRQESKSGQTLGGRVWSFGFNQYVKIAWMWANQNSQVTVKFVQCPRLQLLHHPSFGVFRLNFIGCLKIFHTSWLKAMPWVIGRMAQNKDQVHSTFP